MAKEPDELEIDEPTDDEEPTVAYDIAAYPSDLTLSVIVEMWKNGDIVIPDFQRNFVWSIKQASLLIESFLLQLPVPQVFFYIDEEGKSVVIDGQQRIMSIFFFVEGYFGLESLQGKRQVFRLKGLNEKSPFLNKRYSDLSEAEQRRLKGGVLRAINIRQLNPKGSPTSMYHIFERLNTGGTPLKPQEIRNCVYRGQLVNVLGELNEDPHWRSILGKNTKDKHQKDVELVLRMFAMGYFRDEYEKPMKEFLSVVMERERHGQSKTVERFAARFRVVAELIHKQLGAKPFHVRGPLNSAALEAVFCSLLATKAAVAENLGKRYDKLKEDENFLKATLYSTSDVAVVKERFARTQSILL